MTLLLMSMLVAAPEPGLFWGFTLEGGGQIATDEDVDDVGRGWIGELRFDLGEMVTESVGVGIATGFGTGTTSLFTTSGGFLGLSARILADRFSVHPVLGVAFLGLSRRDADAKTDDDPGSLFGARTGVGVAYDVLRFDNGFALALGADVHATYGSGLVIAGAGATVSITSYVRPGQTPARGAPTLQP